LLKETRATEDIFLIPSCQILAIPVSAFLAIVFLFAGIFQAGSHAINFSLHDDNRKLFGTGHGEPVKDRRMILDRKLFSLQYRP
jgi:hypothetical protein